MTTLEQQKTIVKESSSTENINELLAHKFNLFQQFFVIGFDPKIMYNIHKMDLTKLPNELSLPKIISKYFDFESLGYNIFYFNFAG